MKKHKRRHVQFTDKKQSKMGMLSLAGSGISFFWLIYAIVKAGKQCDQLGNVVGGIGVLVLLLQLAALITAVRANREEDVFPGIPRTALVVAILLLLLWLMIYGLGIYALIGV